MRAEIVKPRAGMEARPNENNPSQNGREKGGGAGNGGAKGRAHNVRPYENPAVHGRGRRDAGIKKGRQRRPGGSFILYIAGTVLHEGLPIVRVATALCTSAKWELEMEI